MAAPPTQASSPLVAGLLQSLAPWMTGANPSALDNSFQQYGGTTGLLSAMLQDAPGSQGAANFGKALQGVQSDALQRAAARQQLASQNIGLQQNLAMFPYFMRALAQYGGGAAPSQAQSASAPSMVTPSADSTDEQPQAATSASGATPATAQPSAAPAASAAPQSGTNLASGLNLARIMALTNRPGADTFLRSLTADPAYITQSKLAGDPLVIDQAEMAEAARAQDPQAYLSAYTKYLTDANRLHISSMSGNVTGFGLPPWVLQSMVGYNPQTGKLTANGRQDLIPGAASTEAALAAAREGAETAARVANTPINIPTGGGGSTFNYPGSVIGMPPALRGAGGALAPRTAPSQAVPAPNATPPATKGKDVWSTVPKLNVPQNTGEADFFTQGRLRAAGEADIKLSSELGEDAATADQQLEYNREAMRELPTAEAGPMSNMLTHFRSAFIELGVPDGLIPKGGSVVPTQELNKSLKNAALQGARELYGSRMTQTEVKLQTEEMSPSSSMMKDAISSLIKQNNIRLMYSKAKAADYQVYRDHGGDPTRYDSWYATTFPIQKFAQAAEKAMQ